MAKREEMEIHISPDGEVKIDVKNLKGKRCLEYLDLFVNAIGPIKEKQMKPEFYEPESKAKIDIQSRESR